MPSPGGPIPHNLARPLIGPPTLKHSGSEHRRAVFLFFPEGKCLRNEVFYLNPWCLRQKVVSLQQSLNIGGYTMIEIKETLVIKSDSPKVAEWVKRMKAYKAAQLQDMAKRGCEVCEIAM